MKQSIKEIWEYRDMIAGLVRRAVKGKYKGSVLGFLWTFINPLLQLGVYTVLFTVIMPLRGIDKYYLFLFVALIPWIFFSTSLAQGAGCVFHESSMVTKIYFPREVLPIAHVTASFVTMLLTMLVVIAVALFSGVHFTLGGLIRLPFVMLLEYLLALGFTMIVSAVAVYFRDVEYIMQVVMLAWQFLTPIMYSVDIVPANLLGIYMLNPMTPIILAYRDILYFGTTPSLSMLWQGALWALVFLLSGFYIFGKLKRRFAEEM